jgi:hypothetical protein
MSKMTRQRQQSKISQRSGSMVSGRSGKSGKSGNKSGRKTGPIPKVIEEDEVIGSSEKKKGSVYRVDVYHHNGSQMERGRSPKAGRKSP